MLGPGRGIKLLLESFINRIDDHVVIVFMGYGLYENDIKKACQSYSNIFFHEAVSTDVLLNFTSSADIGISIIENNCLSYNYCMPNKLFEYSIVGLPVIVSNMKEMSEYVVKNNIGIVVESNSCNDINNSINKILSMDLKTLSKNAIRSANKNSWEVQEN